MVKNSEDATMIKFLKSSLNWIVAIGLCFTATVSSQYKVLHHFSGNSNDGAKSAGSLIKYGNKLFGMTFNGGDGNKGTVFSINIDGTDFRILHSFVSGSSDGEGPIGALLLSDSTLFGMASSSGTNYGGTLFKIHTDGNGFEVLHRFSTTDGMWPWGSLIQSDSILY